MLMIWSRRDRKRSCVPVSRRSRGNIRDSPNWPLSRSESRFSPLVNRKMNLPGNHCPPHAIVPNRNLGRSQSDSQIKGLGIVDGGPLRRAADRSPATAAHASQTQDDVRDLQAGGLRPPKARSASTILWMRLPIGLDARTRRMERGTSPLIAASRRAWY